MTSRTTLFGQALVAPTLGDAIAPIQAALGIASGDVAANVFSGLPNGDDSWPSLTIEEREEWLGRWLQDELLYANNTL